MEKLFKWASSTFALLPGVAIIVTNLGTPPGISKVLLGGIIEACGAFTLLTLNHRKVALSKIDQRKRKRAAITFFILFFLSLLIYIILFQVQVVEDPKYEPVLFPFWNNADLENMIQMAHSRYNALDMYGSQAVLNDINSSKMPIAITVVCFITTYTLVFEFLTLGFGFIAVAKNNVTPTTAT